ncbi:hypothetical protein DPMN_154439 [Dreissena polymorpha]|uniref:Uncharacterized protein n=1 Tax=Dreissena polymorpha TaxID=45954 RepID=A0A9D4J5Q4_DREPO|nr:hypothetical protein DPMN_154439 [Dreissena polymorpha]
MCYTFLDIVKELESLFSEHFGRTPVSTPYASQTLSDSDHERDESCSESTESFVSRARSALVQVSREDESSDSDPEQVLHECDELASLHKFMQGCGCKKHCAKNFSLGKIQEHVCTMRELSKEEKERFLMGVLTDAKCETTKRGMKSQRDRTHFYVKGKTVCKTTFMTYYDI